MSLTYDKLAPEQIASELMTVPGWRIESGELTRALELDSYQEVLVTTMIVGKLAEDLNHHPDMRLSYKQLEISMVTHDADGGLTAYDFELARRINAVLSTD